MGIRIHKIIGWGLNNIIAEKFEVIDPRINTDFFGSEDYWNKLEDMDTFFTWLKENEEENVKILNEVEPPVFDKPENYETKYDIPIRWAINGWDANKNNEKKKEFNRYPITYDPEFGKKEVMLFSPIDELYWSRYDDIIDYYEQDEQHNEVKMLNNSCGIYPYVFMVHIPNAPNFGKEGYPNTMWPAEYNQSIGVFFRDNKPLLEEPLLSYFKKWYRPTIAPIVILYIKYLNIFKYFNETIHELRPMIYTYWA